MSGGGREEKEDVRKVRSEDNDERREGLRLEGRGEREG